MKLQKPICSGGYTKVQIEEILKDEAPKFWKWMNGQTMMMCEGREYDHDTKSYKPICGGVAHGEVVYPWDLERYLQGLPPLD